MLSREQAKAFGKPHLAEPSRAARQQFQASLLPFLRDGASRAPPLPAVATQPAAPPHRCASPACLPAHCPPQVTPRRWLAFCNPPLRQLITATLGNDRWINDTDRLKVSQG